VGNNSSIDGHRFLCFQLTALLFDFSASLHQLKTVVGASS
jgi:hypothetical protein